MSDLPCGGHYAAIALSPDQTICLEDGKPAVPKGFFGVNKQDYWSVAGRVLVNLGDLVGTKHSGGINGCCGLDGMDGPNLVCANGHEIGTGKVRLLDAA